MKVTVKRGVALPRPLTQLDYERAYDVLHDGVPDPVQDGLLQYYNSIAPFADANVERRLEAEPYEWPYGKPSGCSLK